MAGEFDAHERRMWDGAAEPYARVFAALCGATADAVLDTARVGAGVRLLDVGTGPGTVAAAALRRGAEVTAVDAEPGMLAIAAERARGAALRSAVLPELPFGEGEFDAVTANFVLNHVEDPIAALSELRRVVRPGGRVGATVWHGTANRAMALYGAAFDAAGVERPVFPTIPVDFERTAEGFGGLLVKAGWAEVDCREVVWTHRVDPDVWWSGAVEGVASVGLVLAGLSEPMQARVRAEYDRLAAGQVDGDGRLALPAVALLAGGTH